MSSSNGNDRPHKKQKTNSSNNPLLLKKFSLADAPVPSVPVVDPNKDALFASLLHPLDPNEFRQHYFRHTAACVTRAPVARLQPLLQAMQDLDPAHLLSETSSDQVFVWLCNNQKNQPTNKIQSIQVDAETALALHRAGHATYCRASPQVEQPLVARLLQGTGMGCGQYDPSGTRTQTLGRGEVEVFSGTKGHTTDWHFDFQENFTIQLSGSKRWTLQRGTVDYPLLGCTPHYQAPEVVENQLKAARLADPNFTFKSPVGKEQEEVVLEPGDMLYFPAGMWHRVETLEPGVSINISLMATNYAALICSSLQHFLQSSGDTAAWRETIVRTPNRNPLTQVADLLRRLPSLVESFSQQQQQGAHCILPPVLLHPPAFASVGEEEESAPQEESDIEEGNAEPEEEEPVDEEEEEEELVVDVNTFVGPPEWEEEQNNYDANGEATTFVVNPLASLMPLTDITSFYKDSSSSKKSDGGSDDDDDKLRHVLNVNYAGNDMHESMVRVVLQNFRSTDVPRLRPGEEYSLPATGFQRIPPWAKCLIYYGFWNRKGSDAKAASGASYST